MLIMPNNKPNQTMEKLMRTNSKSGLSSAAFVLSVVLPFLAMAHVFSQGPTGANPTGAQEQLAGNAASPLTGAPAPGATAEAERVIVTGSNIPTAEEVGPNPVTNLNRDYIQKSGSVDTTQLLKDQPVNNSNAVPTANNGTSQGGPVGFTSVALRGLDPSATLVLLDGRRVTRVLGGTFVDINTIPLAAVESIEILKSGASAVYGADAVAGVVNIKLWKDFRGVQVSQYYGNTLDKDAGAYKADVLFGVGDDKISIAGDIFYFHHNSTFNSDYATSAVPPFLSSNAIPWNLNVSKVVAAAAGAPVATGSTSTQQFVTGPTGTNGLSPASDYIAANGRVRSP